MPAFATNLITALTVHGETMSYDGYASCPLTISAGKVMLAEFCYDGVVTRSFPMDPRSPRKIYCCLKQSFIPSLYWNIVIKRKRWPLTHKRRDFPAALPTINP